VCIYIAKREKMPEEECLDRLKNVREALISISDQRGDLADAAEKYLAAILPYAQDNLQLKDDREELIEVTDCHPVSLNDLEEFVRTHD